MLKSLKEKYKSFDTKKRILVWTIPCILVIVLFFFFCKGKNTPEEIRPYDPSALKIAVVPTMECLPFYVADHYKIAEDHGLNLQLFSYNSAMDADTALIHHYVDGSASDFVRVGFYNGHGDSVQVVLCGDLKLMLVSGSRSRISEVKSLKEKVSAITRHSSLDYYLDHLLWRNDMVGEDVNRPQINDIPLRYTMLIQHQYDSAILPEPWASMSLAKGCHQLSTSTDIPKMEGMFALVFTDSIAHVRSLEIKKLKEVYNASVDFINKNRHSKRTEFLELLGVKESFSDKKLSIPSFTHYTTTSDSASIRTSEWIDRRGVLTDTLGLYYN